MTDEEIQYLTRLAKEGPRYQQIGDDAFADTEDVETIRNGLVAVLDELNRARAGLQEIADLSDPEKQALHWRVCASVMAARVLKGEEPPLMR